MNSLKDIQVSIDIQKAEAARIVSTHEFDRKIKFLGKHGTALKRITERLGKLFALVQNNPVPKVLLKSFNLVLFILMNLVH